MKIYDTLKKQLLMSDYSEDAKNCIKIYNKLKELDKGSVWSSKWNILTTCLFKGKYPKVIKIYKPTEIGCIFLMGLRDAKN